MIADSTLALRFSRWVVRAQVAPGAALDRGFDRFGSAREYINTAARLTDRFASHHLLAQRGSWAGTFATRLPYFVVHRNHPPVFGTDDK